MWVSVIKWVSFTDRRVPPETGGFEHWTELQESPESVTVCEPVDKTLIYRHLLRAVLRAPGGEIPRAAHLVILLRSERAARRVMESITALLEETLGFPVNRDKSQVAPGKDVEFLGFQILRGNIRISTATLQESGARLDASEQRPVDDTGHPGPVGIPARMGELFFASESSARCSRNWMASSAAGFAPCS